MNNSMKLTPIESICSTPEQIIKSGDFMRALNIVLKRVEDFDENYISCIFTKLKTWGNLNNEEKIFLKDFISSPKVAHESKRVLSKLKEISGFLEENNDEKLKNFFNMLNRTVFYWRIDSDKLTKSFSLLYGIFGKDWFENIKLYILEVAKIKKLTSEALDSTGK